MATVKNGTKQARLFQGDPNTQPSGSVWDGLKEVHESYDGGDITNYEADDRSDYFVGVAAKSLQAEIVSYTADEPALLAGFGYKELTEGGAIYDSGVGEKVSLAYITTVTDVATKAQSEQIRILYGMTLAAPDTDLTTGPDVPAEFTINGTAQSVTFVKDNSQQSTPILIINSTDENFDHFKNLIFGDPITGEGAELVTPQDYLDYDPSEN